MNNFRPAQVILYTFLAWYTSPANAITEAVKLRAQADLKGKCLEMFLDEGSSSGVGYQPRPPSKWGVLWITPQESHAFAVAEYNSQQYCGYAKKEGARWEDAEKAAIAACESSRPQGGPSCEVYAHDNDIVYVSIHEKLKTVKMFLKAGDTHAAERAINEIDFRNLSAFSPIERDEYDTSLVQLEEAAKEQARLDAIEAERKAKQQAILEKEWEKQAKINAIKAERDAREKEKIRKAEAKRIAKEGDGSEDDKTCQSYGARPGSQVYVNCRIQLGIAKQVAGEQRAAQRDAQASQAEYNRRLEAARQEAQAQRDAADERRRQGAALRAIGGEIIRNSTPPPPPPSDRVRMNCITQGNTTQCY